MCKVAFFHYANFFFLLELLTTWAINILSQHYKDVSVSSKQKSSFLLLITYNYMLKKKEH